MEERENSEAMRGVDHTIFNSLEEVRKQVTDLRVAVAALPSKAGGWIAAASLTLIIGVASGCYFLGSKIEGLQSNDRVYVGRVDALETQAATLSTRTSQIERQVSAHHEQIRTLATEYDAIEPVQRTAVKDR